MEQSALARDYHSRLPPRLWSYLLRDRGIAERVIHAALLGWDGNRITIPIFDQERNLAFFKLAKDPSDTSDRPKMMLPRGARAELYGWNRVRESTQQIVICEGEYDRLVLESHGFWAVTSTAGAGTFRPEWAESFKAIPRVYACFDNDDAGRAGAEHVAKLIPQARIVRLPDEVGPAGDVTDFFVRLGKTEAEFNELLKSAAPLPNAEPHASVAPGEKAGYPIAEVVGRYVELRPSGANLVAHCPFHQDRTPSFVVFPATESFYCFGCRAHGDAIGFVMRMEQLTFREALGVLQNLYGRAAK